MTSIIQNRWQKWRCSDLWSMQVVLEPGFESRVKWASWFKKSQTAVSTTERYFTLSVVCHIVECTKMGFQLGVTKNNIQIVVVRFGWKCDKRSVIKVLLLKQKEVELLLYMEYMFDSQTFFTKPAALIKYMWPANLLNEKTVQWAQNICQRSHV